MRVRQGWSGEHKPNQWGKFSVELDETDLRRILIDHGTSDDDVDRDLRDLPVIAAYRLLEIEAERLVVRKLCTRYDFDAEHGAREIGRLNEEFLLTLTRYVGARPYPAAEPATEPAAGSVTTSVA